MAPLLSKERIIHHMLWYYPLAGQNFDAVEVDVPGGVEDMDELANDI